MLGTKHHGIEETYVIFKVSSLVVNVQSSACDAGMSKQLSNSCQGGTIFRIDFYKLKNDCKFDICFNHTRSFSRRFI